MGDTEDMVDEVAEVDVVAKVDEEQKGQGPETAHTVLSHLRGKLQAPLAAPSRALVYGLAQYQKAAMARARIFHQLLHYLHELPLTPIFLPEKSVLNATIFVVFSSGNAGKETT